MSHSDSDRNPVEVLAEEFMERQRRGERPTLAEYVERYPQWADDIRDLFPALVVMEQLKPAAHDRTGPYGLQAGIYTQNIRKAFEAVKRIDVGGLMVNDTSIFRVDQMPYGGNRMSGIGREGVRFAI